MINTKPGVLPKFLKELRIFLNNFSTHLRPGNNKADNKYYHGNAQMNKRKIKNWKMH